MAETAIGASHSASDCLRKNDSLTPGRPVKATEAAQKPSASQTGAWMRAMRRPREQASTTDNATAKRMQGVQFAVQTIRLGKLEMVEKVSAATSRARGVEMAASRASPAAAAAKRSVAAWVLFRALSSAPAKSPSMVVNRMGRESRAG